MKKPKLLVMAAGLGSRYGGLKQMESMTPEGEIILDFSCFDAVRAGFSEIVFVIKAEMEEAFKERVLGPMSAYVKVSYVIQDLRQLPDGFVLPVGRTKPWGTCHAVLAAKDLLGDAPFAVINADDYYGRDAFKKVYDFLVKNSDEDRYCMAGYYIENTLSDQGTVTRGVCHVQDGYLTDIDETKNIGWKDHVGGEIVKTLANGSQASIPQGTVVSMNFWGFMPSIIHYMEQGFSAFWKEAMIADPLKAEYLLPVEVGRYLTEGRVKVAVLDATDKWFGVTYKEDLPKVQKAFSVLKEEGKYPRILWPRMMDRIGLKFGTAGLRATMAPGPDHMNDAVVRTATVGLAAHLLKKEDSPRVVVSYDTRNHSAEFARVTAQTLQTCGVEAELFAEPTPVPIISFAVRYGKYSAGVMITASHNPKEYNGYKVYGPTGGQILEEDATAIEREIKLANVNLEWLQDAKVCKKEVAIVSPGVMEAYLQAMDTASPFATDGIHVVYTPLYGSGKAPVLAMMQRNGISHTIVQEEAEPNGDFPNCPRPNPDMASVYALAVEYAKREQADLIIATDPDCDRIGCMVASCGGYRILSGNEIGTILSEFFCAAGKKGTLVTTVVSTPIIEKIAAAYGNNAVRTLVGFKYIGEQIDLLGEDFIFGFEESNGVLCGNYARDKDGVLGVKLLCAAASFYKKQGKTLLDALAGIYAKYGMVVNKTVSLEVASQEAMVAMMSRVRNVYPNALDYSAGIHGLPKANVVEIRFADGARMIVRPSGTEPVIKLYLSAASEERVGELQKEFEALLRKEFESL